jgi:predicted short-subunit dehydrogenase-like oxidoreductase (DUF2520 family)
MMSRVRIAIASVAVGGLLLPAAAIAGGTLSRADFERCNQQAMQVAGISDSQSPARRRPRPAPAAARRAR